MILRRTVAVLALSLLACSSSSSSTSPSADAGPDGGYTPSPIIAARPYGFKEPPGYDPKTPTPLFIVLHGYGANGLAQQAYLGFALLSETHTFLLAYPDGTYDSQGQRFWNATDACCNIDHKDIDDVAYVNAIIDDVTAQYNVDPKRIFLIGHSNGAFLSHRFACEHGDRVAAIVTIAGMQWNDPTKCPAATPVAVLQVHGDADEVIAYNGGMTSNGTFPSAHQTVATWAQKNGCTGPIAATSQMLDLDSSLAGSETTAETYSGCPRFVGLWTIKGGKHLPAWSVAWPEQMYGWFMANPKP
jgi:polyhydroxybutyrate depolymerase